MPQQTIRRLPDDYGIMAFMDGLFITARQTVVLFMLMAFGFGAGKFRILDAPSVKRLADFVLVVVTPCLIVTSFQRPFDSAVLVGVAWAFAAAVFTHLTSIAFARLAVHDRDAARERVLRFATVFSNAGFMGFPLEYALLGPEGVFYGSVYVVVFHLLCWTYGVWEINGGFGGESPLKAFVNPGLVGVAIGLPFFLLSVKLPQIVAEPVKAIGDMNTSLSMVVLGFYLSGARFAVAFSASGTYVTLALRHIVVPAVLTAVMLLVPGIDPTVRMAAVIPAAAPVGASVAMFAVRYGGDGEFPAALVAVSTVFSIVTMPVVIGFAKTFFGGMS